MNTLTVGGTAAGKTYSLGQRYRQARKDGAVVWSYATGGNARYPHFEGAEWSVTDDHLAEMLKMALGAVIARAESGPGQWGPVRILIDDPEIDFYEREPGETLTALARTGSANGVEIHLTVSPGHLDFMPADLRAQFYEVDLREARGPGAGHPGVRDGRDELAHRDGGDHAGGSRSAVRGNRPHRGLDPGVMV